MEMPKARCLQIVEFARTRRRRGAAQTVWFSFAFHRQSVTGAMSVESVLLGRVFSNAFGPPGALVVDSPAMFGQRRHRKVHMFKEKRWNAWFSLCRLELCSLDHTRLV